MEEGEYVGVPFIGIKATNFEKGAVITLKHVYLEHFDDRFHRIPDDVADKFSLYKLLTHHLTVNCPPRVGRIFRHKAPLKQLKVRSLSLSRLYLEALYFRNLTLSPSSTFLSNNLPGIQGTRIALPSQSAQKWHHQYQLSEYSSGEACHSVWFRRPEEKHCPFEAEVCDHLHEDGKGKSWPPERQASCPSQKRRRA